MLKSHACTRACMRAVFDFRGHPLLAVCSLSREDFRAHPHCQITVSSRTAMNIQENKIFMLVFDAASLLLISFSSKG